MNLHLRPRRGVFVALTVATALALSACGTSGSSGSGSSSGNSSAPLYKDLPANIQKAGAINVGSSIDYPPFEYYKTDGKTLQGFEVELGALLEKQLGVSLDWHNASFDTLLPALASKRYDIVYGATNDTAEREQSFDFVYYLQSSQAFVSKAGNPQNITTVDDLCGKAIAAVRGGVQAQYLTAQSTACTKAGKAKINLLTFGGNAEEQLAVKEGKAAALLENYPTAAAFAQASNGTLELIKGLQVEKQFFGMVLDKNNTELRDALVKAWQAIIDDGSYAKVLTKWKLSDIGVTKAGVNAVATNAAS